MKLSIPMPTGRSPVGTTLFHMIDKSRREPFDDSPPWREFVVQAWYPADPEPGARPLAGPAVLGYPGVWYVPGLLPAGGDDPLQGEIIRRVSAEFAFLEVDVQSAPLKTHSFPEAPLAQSEKLYPVLLFSAGYETAMIQSTFQMEELASHGYVVFSIEHPYEASANIFPDGRVIFLDEKHPRLVQVYAEQGEAMGWLNEWSKSPPRPESIPGLFEELIAKTPTSTKSMDTWTADARFVIDELERINRGESEHLFAGRLDLDRLGALGFSFGGATAAQLCLTDPRCKAGVNMDGLQFGRVCGQSISQPFMVFYHQWNPLLRINDHAYRNFTGTTFALTIRGTEHHNFAGGSTWFSALGIADMIGTIDVERGYRIINDYVLAFFGAYLNGKDSDLLKGPSAAYPETVFEMTNPR